MRGVELSLAGVDADLANRGFETERAAFVGNDGYNQLSHFRMLEQGAQHAHESHRGGNSAATRSAERVAKELEFRSFETRFASVACWHEAAKVLAALLHVLDFRCVLFRTIWRAVFCGFVRHRNIEDLAECLQRFVS